MDTHKPLAREEVVEREARALREALLLFEKTTPGGAARRLVASRPLKKQASKLERLIDRPEATREAQKTLEGSVGLAEQVAQRLQAPPQAKPSFIKKLLGGSGPAPDPAALEHTAKLGKALQEELEQHRRTIENLR